VGEVGTQVFHEEEEGEGNESRAPEAAAPANVGDCQDLDGARGEHDGRGQDAEIVSVEAAEPAREHRLDGEVEDAVIGRVDARRFGGVEVLADGPEGEAVMGADDAAQDEIGDQHHAHDGVEVGQIRRVFEEARGGEAHRPTCQVYQVARQAEQGQADEPGPDGGKNAAQPQRQQAKQQANYGGGQDADKDGDPGGPAEVDRQQAGGIGANAEEGGETEVDDVDVAGGEVEGDGLGGDEGCADQP